MSKITTPNRCRSKVAHTRQSRPASGLSLSHLSGKRLGNLSSCSLLAQRRHSVQHHIVRTWFAQWDGSPFQKDNLFGRSLLLNPPSPIRLRLHPHSLHSHVTFLLEWCDKITNSSSPTQETNKEWNVGPTFISWHLVPLPPSTWWSTDL